MSAELAGLAGILAFASAWELAGSAFRQRLVRLSRRRAMRARSSGALAKLERAGLDRSLGATALTRMKVTGATAGAAMAVVVAPAAPGKLAPLVIAGLVGAGALAPDAWIERSAHRRQRELAAALPDALDLLAVGVASGRTPVALMRELAGAGPGALSVELGLVVADIDCGIPQGRALAALRARTGVPELGALAAAIDRSRRFGSPLAAQLHSQAAGLRIDESRRLGERAARAAPKIQLVVAMVLVPSALLAIAAALVAHGGSLVGAF